MKRIGITADFTGYPDGKTGREFRTGEQPDDLDPDYADLLVRKGLAEDLPAAGQSAIESRAEEPAPPAPAASGPAVEPAPATQTQADAPAGEKEPQA